MSLQMEFGHTRLIGKGISDRDRVGGVEMNRLEWNVMMQ